MVGRCFNFLQGPNKNLAPPCKLMQTGAATRRRLLVGITVLLVLALLAFVTKAIIDEGKRETSLTAEPVLYARSRLTSKFLYSIGALLLVLMVVVGVVNRRTLFSASAKDVTKETALLAGKRTDDRLEDLIRAFDHKTGHKTTERGEQSKSTRFTEEEIKAMTVEDVERLFATPDDIRMRIGLHEGPYSKFAFECEDFIKKLVTDSEEHDPLKAYNTTRKKAKVFIETQLGDLARRAREPNSSPGKIDLKVDAFAFSDAIEQLKPFLRQRFVDALLSPESPPKFFDTAVKDEEALQALVHGLKPAHNARAESKTSPATQSMESIKQAFASSSFGAA